MLEVDDYIYRQSEKNAEILALLRELILNAAPFTEETIKYKIPFYSLKKALCYLNVSKGKVHLAFINGFLIASGKEILEIKNRKYIRSIQFSSASGIKQQLVNQILQEAILLDANY